MERTIIYLVIILILVLLIYYFIHKLKVKLQFYLRKYFNTTSLKSALDSTKMMEENTPKTLSSMEEFILPRILKDFPDLNINEIKALAEEGIINILDSIEDKKQCTSNKMSDEIITLINSKINDLNNDTVHFDSIKIHKSVLKDYVRHDDIFSIYIASSLEFMYAINNKDYKKIQTRVICEIVHVIDTDNMNDKRRNIGLNCPNCGAPIRDAKARWCKFCGSGLVDIVKRTWILNNIKKY